MKKLILLGLMLPLFNITMVKAQSTDGAKEKFVGIWMLKEWKGNTGEQVHMFSEKTFFKLYTADGRFTTFNVRSGPQIWNEGEYKITSASAYVEKLNPGSQVQGEAQLSYEFKDNKTLVLKYTIGDFNGEEVWEKFEKRLN